MLCDVLIPAVIAAAAATTTTNVLIRGETEMVTIWRRWIVVLVSC